MTTKGGSIFESINLSSTIREAPPLSAAHTRLESVASLSDDEDLDPAEFISTESPELLTTEPLKNDQIDTTELESDSQLLDDFQKIFPSSMLKTNDSPIQHLQNEYHQLQSELNHNIQLLHQALENGSSNLNKIRDLIATNYYKLSENQYSLNELYRKESVHNQQVHQRLKKWDDRRTQILKKIKIIKSDDNVYGTKLSGLLDESTILNNDIAEMEAKLSNLKSKKQLLQNEIDEASSVLESQTSKFVNAFKELDKNGEEFVSDILRQNGLTEIQSKVLLKSIPVDVTFENQYKQKLKESILVEQAHRLGFDSKTTTIIEESEQDKSPSKLTKPTINPQPINSNTMGTQAYEPPPDFFSQPETKNSDPYDKGFSQGQAQSERFKAQLQQIYENYIKPFLEQQRKGFVLTVDDNENTVSSKVDLNPIAAYLEHKVDAYLELSKQASKMSAVYHQYNSHWKDLCATVTGKEKELEASISNLNLTDATITSILSSILDDLLEYIDIINSVDANGDQSLKQLILYEVTALLEALKMIPSTSKSLSKEFKAKFKSKGLFSKGNIPLTQNQSHEDTSGLEYTYNVSKNAIEHRIIEPVVAESRSPKKKSSNAKLRKDE